jgi:AraC-like DNA-binding protein
MCIQNDIHTRNQQKTIEAVNYIESNFIKPISLAELASLSHISISHLVRSFVQTYNVSPIEYLIQVRLKHAKRLLRSQSYTVSEIAEKTGFNSINYFSRVFKHHEGMCPSKYQKAATSDHV